MYKVVVTDLWYQGVCSASTVFFGVSAGVLSTMVLLTSMLEDTTFPLWTPIGVFIAGAWHPKAHNCFGKAVVNSDCRVLVVNHRQDSLCSWREQDAFWQQLAIEYRGLQLELSSYQGSAAAELYGASMHDLGSRLAASVHFWNWLLWQNHVNSIHLTDIIHVACDLNEITFHHPFPGYFNSLGLRLLCRLWKHMWIPSGKDGDWSKELLECMQQWCDAHCLKMLCENCFLDWPTCLGSPELGQYYLEQLCDSFANSRKDGALVSNLRFIPVRFERLHNSADMDLYEVSFVMPDPWLQSHWFQNGTAIDDVERIIFTHPCIVVFHFDSGQSFLGFYQSHVKRRPSKRKADGTKKQFRNWLNSLVIACIPQTTDGLEVERLICERIEVIQLTSLMGIGSLGRMLFPLDKRFHAWFAETDAITGLPALDMSLEAVLETVVPALSVPAEVGQNLRELMSLVQHNLMTAILGPPGTGQNSQ